MQHWLANSSPWPEHDRYRVGGKEIEKERVLTLDGLKAFFAMLDSEDADVTDTVRVALKCVLLTAQRPGEVAGMMLSELHDLDGPAPHWTIPAARTKNKLAEHTVPLSPAAVRLIGEGLNASKDEALDASKEEARGTNDQAVFVGRFEGVEDPRSSFAKPSRPSNRDRQRTYRLHSP